jgi:hypothetical protein
VVWHVYPWQRLVRISIMCGATCLPMECFFSKHGNPSKYQWTSALKIQLRVLVEYKSHMIIISRKFILFSPWWKIVHVAFNNNHSFAHLYKTAMIVEIMLNTTISFQSTSLNTVNVDWNNVKYHYFIPIHKFKYCKRENFRMGVIFA